MRAARTALGRGPIRRAGPVVATRTPAPYIALAALIPLLLLRVPTLIAVRPRFRTASIRVVGALVCAIAVAATFPGGATAADVTFSAAGSEAVATLLHVYYAGSGLWRACNTTGCGAGNLDWGNDSLTYALALRYDATHEADLKAQLLALIGTAHDYPAPCVNTSGCSGWSDVPEWDTIALMDEYQATGDPAALTKAEAAFGFVEQSSAYALGACPRIRYQQPYGQDNHLKTLETDGNAIKAALLLYRATGQVAYLRAAETHYDSVRTYFLDPRVPLYSVYVFDNGSTCSQVPHRFFASVNGDMIWSGVELYRDTGNRAYLAEAVATAQAVDQDLSDGRGVFADLQAENDLVEPLVEGMYALATRGQTFARKWIIRNAGAALAARGTDGSFGRFFDGPPPATTVTDWQTNGGLALEIAAAALAPSAVEDLRGSWGRAVHVTRDISALPTSLTIRAAGIAVLGTLGEQCCEAGHARVLVDGKETLDGTGIWQNKSSSGRSIPNTVLFAWRWPSVSRHTLTFEAGAQNAKEGGPFLHVTSYELLLRAK